LLNLQSNTFCVKKLSMKYLLFVLILGVTLQGFSQELHNEFDGSYSIIIESPKMIDVRLSQSELEYVYSLRKPDERVVISIREFQVLLLSENEYAQGIRITQHTVTSHN